MGSNAVAFAKLGRHQLLVEALGEEFVSRTTAEAADFVERQLKSDLDSGKDAYGAPMAKRKDGEPAMVGAFDKHVRVDAIGNTVLIRLRGKHAVLHHHGHGRGQDTKRRIIPVNLIPIHWLPKLRGVAVKNFNRILRAGGSGA